MAYALGPVKPHVKAAADEIGGKFNVSTVYGFATRANISDHPLGLALDFMVYGDRAKGDAIAAYATANHSRLGIKYVIWYQRIWTPETNAWKQMESRGGTTADHKDHPHISFLVKPGSGPVIENAGGTGIQIGMPDLNPLDNITNAFKGFSDVFAWISQNTWRILAVLGGAILILIALFSWGTVKDTVTKTAGKVVQNGS